MIGVNLKGRLPTPIAHDQHSSRTRPSVSPLAAHTGRFEAALLDAAQQQQAQDEAQMESDFLGLNPTEQVVLWRMLEQGHRYRPCDAEALRFYRDKTG